MNQPSREDLFIAAALQGMLARTAGQIPDRYLEENLGRIAYMAVKLGKIAASRSETTNSKPI